MIAMVKSVINGGAGGLRLAGEYHIKAIRDITNLPIIGITKPNKIPVNFKEIVYITPDFTNARKVKNAGADIIAIDATMREHPEETLEELINIIHKDLNCPVMADISTLQEGLNAVKLGADIISTTLSGYTSYSNETKGPDFTLLDELIQNTNVPVILEGRVETPQEVEKALKIGAYAVVIGSAITRPHMITDKFVRVVRK
jgi:N-acylglucosamine-6-phosphate 2-epimerase